VVSYVQKYHLVFCLANKFKQNPVSRVNGKAPLVLEFTVETVRIEPHIKRVMAKEHDAFARQRLQLGV